MRHKFSLVIFYPFKLNILSHYSRGFKRDNWVYMCNWVFNKTTCLDRQLLILKKKHKFNEPQWTSHMSLKWLLKTKMYDASKLKILSFIISNQFLIQVIEDTLSITYSFPSYFVHSFSVWYQNIDICIWMWICNFSNAKNFIHHHIDF